MQVAILEDDPDQAELLKAWLSESDMKVSWFETGAAFRAAVRQQHFDLFILDWMLPDASGLDILENLRTRNFSVPVLFLTVRDDEEDIVRALQAGADDYIVKPARKAIFRARVNNALRHYGHDQSKPILDFPPFQINLEARSLYRDGEEIALTRREYELAVYFFRHIDHLMPRDKLLEDVWGISAQINTRTIDTHISRLRSKLGLNESNGWRLVSVYQYGYRLERVETD